MEGLHPPVDPWESRLKLSFHLLERHWCGLGLIWEACLVQDPSKVPTGQQSGWPVWEKKREHSALMCPLQKKYGRTNNMLNKMTTTKDALPCRLTRLVSLVGNWHQVLRHRHGFLQRGSLQAIFVWNSGLEASSAMGLTKPAEGLQLCSRTCPALLYTLGRPMKIRNDNVHYMVSIIATKWL